MSDPKEELLEKFRAYLDDQSSGEDGSAESERHVDLFSLYEELTGLKNEVRIGSRQFKGALDDFRSVFSTLEAANTTLTEKLVQEKEEKKLIGDLTLRPVIFGLLDIYDRIEAGLRVGQDTRPSLLSSLFGKERAALQAFVEGQKMILTRLTDLLASCDVRPMEVEGELFDPVKMHAVATVKKGGTPEGVVVEEVCKGFMQGGTVLRHAEVKINKGSRDE